jgi:hypothetical protein
MLKYQRGLSLIGVVVFSVVLAAVAMTALFSMRQERNLFAVGVDKVKGWFGSAPAQAGQAVRSVTGAEDPGRAIYRCTVDGKTVISNTECAASNGSRKKLDLVETQGVEAPPKPVEKPAAPTSNPALDKIIEKQLR